MAMGGRKSALAEAKGVQHQRANELCNDRRAVTALGSQIS
jgi:plasmid maintenance system antidote protein VapI